MSKLICGRWEKKKRDWKSMFQTEMKVWAKKPEQKSKHNLFSWTCRQDEVWKVSRGTTQSPWGYVRESGLLGNWEALNRLLSAQILPWTVWECFLRKDSLGGKTKFLQYAHDLNPLIYAQSLYGSINSLSGQKQLLLKMVQMLHWCFLPLPVGHI